MRAGVACRRLIKFFEGKMMADDNEPQDGSRPGVLGDGSQAQDLGQTGHPENVVTEADVKEALADVKEAFETVDTPSIRQVVPAPEGGKYDYLTDYLDKAEDRQEALIDESVEESFPASDPPSAKRIT